jgi:hypothetical protein
MDLLDDEILALWRSLSANNVKYIMVGGFATNLHGFNRMTADLDIWIKDDVVNRKNLRSALKEADLGDLESIETMDFLPGWSSILLNSGFELDIMTSLKGFAQNDFDSCYDAALTAIIHDIPVKFLNLEQLITEKKVAGRDKDHIDLIELEKIKKSKN